MLTKLTDYSGVVRCHFINGSNARGCHVVVVSEHTAVDNVTTKLLRDGDSVSSASDVINFTAPLVFDCYHHMFAFDIEANGSVSSLAIAGMVANQNTITTCQIVTEGTHE